MPVISVTSSWSDPIALTERSIVQVQGGDRVRIATADPQSEDDGLIWRSEEPIVFDAGTKIRVRAAGIMGRARIWYGPFK